MNVMTCNLKLYGDVVKKDSISFEPCFQLEKYFNHFEFKVKINRLLWYTPEYTTCDLIAACVLG